MKKYYWLILAFATMLVACSKDSESIDDSTPKVKGNTEVAGKQPVTFGAYVNRATTRAGAEGELIIGNPAAGQVNLQTEGFGVLAYYTDDKPYSSSSQPNFMYNTKVSGANWEYEPIRYWPNENSANDASEGIDRVSFFAYAPYVQVNPVSGMVNADDESGIVYMNRNGAVGDPFVNYHVNFIPSEQVDFCWGVNKTTGKPNVNMTKQAVNEKVEFQFNHALAALNVQVDALSDLLSHPADPIDDKEVADKTKIYVRSVTFEGFADKGSFNLNTASDKVMWYDVAGNDYIDGSTVIVHDGRTNGYEGGSEAVNELPKGLNHHIVQSAPYGDAALTAGVTKTTVNLFESDSDDAPVYVIPTGQPLKMTIVYDVETQVDGLPGYLSDGVTHGTSVENKITKTIKLNDGSMMKLEAGKKYTVNLHLGMTTVKYDANITDWGDHVNTGSVDIPENTMKLGTMSIISGTEAITSFTMWKDETMATPPTVSVVDDNSNPITDFDVEWTSSNTNVATVAADGTVTPVAPGVSTITAKATKDGKISTKSYTMYVNELTGISITSTETDIAIGGTLPVKATLEINGGQGVNGDITNNLPVVTWESSATDKISVASPIAAVKEGNDYISTTTATAAGTAAIGDQAVITASVGNFSDTVTLTCTDSRTVTGVTLGTSTPTTVWRCEGFTVPTVTVQGSENSDLTSVATLTWKVDGADVTETGGVIPLSAAGEHEVTVTASYNNSAVTSDPITVYANEVTGISVAPATTNIYVGRQKTLTATLTHTNNGTITSWPQVSWVSDDATLVSISNPTTVEAANDGTTTTATITATGVAAGVAHVTAKVGTPYAAADVTGSATLTCSVQTLGYYRGYDVSPGILERTLNTNNQSVYALTDTIGNDPYYVSAYATDANKDKLFFQWTFLKSDDELGANGSSINASSAKLPDYDENDPSKGKWTLATNSELGDIYKGKPKLAITIENADGTESVISKTTENKAYAFVDIDKGGTHYRGVLLLRDGSYIPKEGNLLYWGNGSQINNITYTQYLILRDAGCLFLSLTGYYSVTFNQWRDKNYWGCYFASNSYSGNRAYFLTVSLRSNDISLGMSYNTENDNSYKPVRLVKKMD